MAQRGGERRHPSLQTHPPKWCPTRAVVLQAGGHFLRGRLIPERAAGPGLAAGGLKAAGHPGILAGAGGTLLLGAGEGQASGERDPKMAALCKVALRLYPPPEIRHKALGRQGLHRRNNVVHTHLAEGRHDEAKKALF